MNEKFFPLYLILAICLPILFLSIYKVYDWAQRDEAIKAVLQQLKDKKKSTAQLKFAQPVIRFRSFFSWGLSSLALFAILHVLFFPYNYEYRQLLGIVLIVAIFLALLANNFVVHKYWRCPFCKRKLPIKIGRSGARPIICYSCPYCQNNFTGH